MNAKSDTTTAAKAAAEAEAKKAEAAAKKAAEAEAKKAEAAAKKAAEAEAKKAEAAAKKATEAEITIVCMARQGRRRGGRAWDLGETVISASELTDDLRQALEGDPFFSIKPAS